MEIGFLGVLSAQVISCVRADVVQILPKVILVMLILTIIAIFIFLQMYLLVKIMPRRVDGAL